LLSKIKIVKGEPDTGHNPKPQLEDSGVDILDVDIKDMTLVGLVKTVAPPAYDKPKFIETIKGKESRNK